MASKSAKHRKFYELPPDSYQDSSGESCDEQKDTLTKYIRDNLIGSDETFLSPFGRKKILYCDYTASGRSLKFIEDFITSEVLPLYGNTHTTTSVTSLQTTLYRHESRDIVRTSCGAGEHDAVIFTGSGCTGAVHKLVSALALEPEEKVTVLVGPWEHHSNILPWRESGALVINIQTDPDTGRTDLNHLQQQLTNIKDQDHIIGCFSAASNVTGILEDDLAVTSLLHSYGALAFWDYAAAAPYVNIQMNPKMPEDSGGLCYKDALYFSTHKFVGGVQTPGVLIAKKTLFRNTAPNGHGGGSVFFVTESDHRYLQEPEVREEGGTPAIVESIRAGLVFKLKASIGVEYIMTKEKLLRNEALATWKNLDNLVLLGSPSEPSLPIFSFLILHPATGLFLHHNYVVALLNDLFGLQTRGGCACAGPYMQKLLGMDVNLVRRYESVLVEDERLDRIGLRRGHLEHSEWEVLRPGATRINIPWFASKEEVDFILKAVSIVAVDGWKLLPMYRFNNQTGEWRHRSNSVFKDRRWLGHVSFTNGKMEYRDNPVNDKGLVDADLEACLDAAKDILASTSKLASRETVPDQSIVFPENLTPLRWFLTPTEAQMCLLTPDMVKSTIPPFQPIITPHNSLSPTCFGSLFENPLLAPSTSKLLSSSSWRRSSMRQSVRKSIPASSKVTVNGVSSVTVLGSDTNNTDITVNGFKSVINVTNDQISEVSYENNFTSDETGKITFDEDETNCDMISDCNNGVCIIPGGVRPEPEVLQTVVNKWKVPSKEIFKPFIEAVHEFSMIKDGDRLLVCLSGGKDSLSLLHAVKQYQFYAKKQGINFEFGAVTVDPMSAAYDPRPLIPYLKQLDVPYLYEQQDIMTQALESKASSICSFCSRMKRGRIYAAARREGYTVLALGQHLDDITESFFMSIFHNGRLRTMKAAYTNKEGDLRIIRPFIYAREKNLRKFAEGSKLPIIAENCPACFEAPKERQRMKQVLAQQELLFPRLYWNLKSALHPVLKIDRTGVESKVFGKGGTEEEEEDF